MSYCNAQLTSELYGCLCMEYYWTNGFRQKSGWTMGEFNDMLSGWIT